MGQEVSSDHEHASSDEANPPDASPGEQGPTSIDEVTKIEALSAYRVMKVFQGSPASRSGLAPFEDFILALNRTIVNSDNTSLANVLRENEGKQVDLVVFNVVDVQRRDVALRPVKWNGPGLLGAAVRYEPIAGAMDHVMRVLDVMPSSPADEAGLVPNTDYIVGTPAEVFRNASDFPKLVRCYIKHFTNSIRMAKR